MGAADWFLQNVGRASWWRALACQQCGGNCCLEGGVDVPLTAGTPIYALGGGALTGAGTFTHSDGSPGYGVVTVNVPGVGQVYYQHIDIAPGIPDCKSGNCNGYQVQAGQLIGYSKNPPGEAEIGINATWGGIWGTNTDPSQWVADPRGALTALASGNNVSPQLGTGNNQTCTQGIPGQCPTDYTCWPVGKSGAPLCAGSTNPLADSRCFPASQVTVIGPSGQCDDGTGKLVNSTVGVLPAWMQDPKRLLKIVGGILLLAGAILIAFWPEEAAAAKAAVFA